MEDFMFEVQELVEHYNTSTDTLVNFALQFIFDSNLEEEFVEFLSQKLSEEYDTEEENL